MRLAEMGRHLSWKWRSTGHPRYSIVLAQSRFAGSTTPRSRRCQWTSPTWFEQWIRRIGQRTMRNHDLLWFCCPASDLVCHFVQRPSCLTLFEWVWRLLPKGKRLKRQPYCRHWQVKLMEESSGPCFCMFCSDCSECSPNARQSQDRASNHSPRFARLSQICHPEWSRPNWPTWPGQADRPLLRFGFASSVTAAISPRRDECFKCNASHRKSDGFAQVTWLRSW